MGLVKKEATKTIDIRKRLRVWVPSGTVVLDLDTNSGEEEEGVIPVPLTIGDDGVFILVALDELATIEQD